MQYSFLIIIKLILNHLKIILYNQLNGNLKFKLCNEKSLSGGGE